MPIAINDTVKAFIEGGVAMTIGTCSAGCVPAIARAWGPRVSKRRQSIDLCVVAAASGATLDNLRDNGRAALTFSFPTDYKTLQIKGHAIEGGGATASDRAAVERHREAFVVAAAAIGSSRDIVRTFIARELLSSPALVKITLIAEEIFDQTPGPSAGEPLRL